jgi:hypothetical protein
MDQTVFIEILFAQVNSALWGSTAPEASQIKDVFPIGPLLPQIDCL